MAESNRSPSTLRRLAIVVRGVVQGVGFRPFVYNAARSCGLSGFVVNQTDTVRIEVQGSGEALEAFLHTLRHSHPPQTRLDSVESQDIPPYEGESQFQIHTSSSRAAPRPTIPADLATCEECVQEIFTPGERRYRYPFTNCTHCGPRWSIIRRLPYDRPRTSMARFALCEACRCEYENPADRRFHAQPVACPLCGPQLRLLDPTGSMVAQRDDALQAAAEALKQGQIVALKGLGGFQLLVDATDQQAVVRLRGRKRRPDRPFAVMFPSLDEVRAACRVGEGEAQTLCSPQAPILLLPRRESALGKQSGEEPTDGSPQPRTPQVADAVAPGNPYLGVMLPYTPLHHLLCRAVARPIVCTSGNLSEEPMVTRTAEALERLGPIADLVLTHNRPILRPVDDSVARFGPHGFQLLRRARGYAPLPLKLNLSGPTILAVGGHLKNTVALALGGERLEVILSPHIGDLDNVLSVEVFRRAIDDLLDFYHVSPELIVCDLHPDYASTCHAETLAVRFEAPLLRVQHHHAHVAACVAEHGLDGPVLGLAWDGTGYGPDGTVWGGEAVVWQDGNFQRAAHLRTFGLPGADKAVREPRRSALGLLFEVLGENAAETAADWFAPDELRLLTTALARGLHSPRTSSMGRLFDAVAAICGLPPKISFEGQAAMALEFAADWSVAEAYPLPLRPPKVSGSGRGQGPAGKFPGSTLGSTPAGAVSSRDRNGATGTPPGDSPAGGFSSGDCPSAGWLSAEWDFEPLLRAVLEDRAAGVGLGRISARFHNALAQAALEAARGSGCSRVVLSGGCFQNALLTDRVCRGLEGSGFSVYVHQQVPPGDGGIALGQVLLGALKSKGVFDVSGNPG